MKQTRLYQPSLNSFLVVSVMVHALFIQFFPVWRGQAGLPGFSLQRGGVVGIIPISGPGKAEGSGNVRGGVLQPGKKVQPGRPNEGAEKGKISVKPAAKPASLGQSSVSTKPAKAVAGPQAPSTQKTQAVTKPVVTPKPTAGPEPKPTDKSSQAFSGVLSSKTGADAIPVKPQDATGGPGDEGAEAVAGEATGQGKDLLGAATGTPGLPGELGIPGAQGESLPGDRMLASGGSLPVYPKNAEDQGVQGSVQIEIYVDPSGAISRVVVVAGSGDHRLDRVAKQTIEQEWAFTPAARGYIVPVQIVFSMEADEEPVKLVWEPIRFEG
ncbi:MAG: TonB family protein [Firmicutes bacterium]|nr:TonB family protein [Bacillota bacterium]